MTLVAFGLMAAALLAAVDAAAPPEADPAASISTPPPTTTEATSTAQSGDLLAAKTVVDIQIVDALSSKTSQIGDSFAIRLAEPIMADGRVLLPAGATGRGEVVHAAKARWGGKAGELVVMARYLECGAQRIPLGHFHFGVSGESHVGNAFAASMVVPLAGFFISGGEVEVPVGARANAKITADVVLSPDASRQCARHELTTEGEN